MGVVGRVLCLIAVFFGASTACHAETRDPRAPHPEARDYWKELSPRDEDNISYIITCLARKSLLSLMFAKSELERRGEETGEIHPLRYLGYIRSDPVLRGDFADISGRPWRSFVNGFTANLASADRRNNLEDDVIEDFAILADVDVGKVRAHIQRKKWREFMELLADRE